MTRLLVDGTVEVEVLKLLERRWVHISEIDGGMSIMQWELTLLNGSIEWHD